MLSQASADRATASHKGWLWVYVHYEFCLSIQKIEVYTDLLVHLCIFLHFYCDMW